MTPEDRTLQHCLPDKIEKLRGLIAAGRPYVWELRLSADEFNSLEAALNGSISSHGGDHSHLLSEDLAVVVVMYLAEWYKRFYKGADTMDDNKVISLTSKELERLYDLAGIDKNTFVYNASKNPDKTSFRWLESLQVLGGLAVQAELKRDERDPLLPQLCRIFHGEEIEIDQLQDRGRAVAFQESIVRQHSLYEYLDCILNREKEIPFHPSDLKDEDTMIPQLLERILHADSEARKNKFDFEWIITYIANRNRMVRSLKVKLKPEVIGGGLKQYIGYDRLRSSEWRVEYPENVGRLELYLRFKLGGQVVARSREPILEYHNTGSERTGFLCKGKIDETIYQEVPVRAFDRVEIVLKYDEVMRTVQCCMVDDYLQVYAIKGSSNRFSSRRNAQAATAVIFSSAYRLADAYRELPLVYARFKKDEEESEEYAWCVINDKVILVGPDGRELMPPFFNRNGLYQVMTKKYLHTIRYRDNTFVLYRYIDTDDEDEEVQEDQLPVLFGRQGLDVRHFATGQAKEGVPVTDYDLEWLRGSRYVDWNEEEPPQGYVRLRVTVKGIVFNPKVYYVPFQPSAQAAEPIWRDFVQHRICTAIEGVEDIVDEFKRQLNHQEPDTRQLEIGNDEAKILVDVYRPVILRELSQQGQIVGYSDQHQTVEIPMLVCNQFSLRDFSEQGVRTYELKAASTAYYGFTTFDQPGMSADNYDVSLPATALLPDIPLDYLKLYITKAMDERSDLWAWDYKYEPRPVAHANEMKDEGIVFQSLKDHASPRHYAMPTIVKAKGWGKKKNQDEEDAVKCFLTACGHHTYFFLFKPLIKCVFEKRMIGDLFLPLLRQKSDTLTAEEVTNLHRFALHFHFDWMLLPREMWMEAISQVADNEQEVQAWQERVLDFFQATPKCTDERERFCLNEFLTQYWTFNDWPRMDGITETALRLIVDDPEALGKRYPSKKDFLKEYDTCRFKFSEMSKVVCCQKP